MNAWIARAWTKSPKGKRSFPVCFQTFFPHGFDPDTALAFFKAAHPELHNHAVWAPYQRPPSDVLKAIYSLRQDNTFKTAEGGNPTAPVLDPNPTAEEWTHVKEHSDCNAKGTEVASRA